MKDKERFLALKDLYSKLDEVETALARFRDKNPVRLKIRDNDDEYIYSGSLLTDDIRRLLEIQKKDLEAKINCYNITYGGK